MEKKLYQAIILSVAFLFVSLSTLFAQPLLQQQKQNPSPAQQNNTLTQLPGATLSQPTQSQSQQNKSAQARQLFTQQKRSTTKITYFPRTHKKMLSQPHISRQQQQNNQQLPQPASSVTQNTSASSSNSAQIDIKTISSLFRQKLLDSLSWNGLRDYCVLSTAKKAVSLIIESYLPGSLTSTLLCEKLLEESISWFYKKTKKQNFPQSLQECSEETKKTFLEATQETALDSIFSDDIPLASVIKIVTKKFLLEPMLGMNHKNFMIDLDKKSEKSAKTLAENTIESALDATIDTVTTASSEIFN